MSALTWASEWATTLRVAPPFSRRRRELLEILRDENPDSRVEVGPPATPVEFKRVTQYVVRYGDGEVELVGDSRDDAVLTIREKRSWIRIGKYDADDYEPMSIVSRTHVVSVSPWVEAIA